MALISEVKEFPALGYAAEVLTCFERIYWCSNFCIPTTEYVDFFTELAPTALKSYFIQIICLIPAITIAWAIEFYLFALESSTFEYGPIIEINQAWQFIIFVLSWALWYFYDCTL